MEEKEKFPVTMTQDSNGVEEDLPEEEHSIWYMKPQDLADLLIMADLALANPKSKFLKRYSELVKKRKQFKDALKNMGGNA